MTGCCQVTTADDQERAAEELDVARTTDGRLAELTARIRTLHGYELPEIVALKIAAGNPAYLQWIEHETTPIPPETR